MIRSIFFPPVGDPQYDIDLKDVLPILEQPDGLLWIDLSHPDHLHVNSVLENIFKFHPLAIEDCLNDGFQAPKVDDYDSYIFIIAHAISHDKDPNNFEFLATHELNIFLGNNYVVTLSHDEKMEATEFIWQRLKRDERLHTNGSDFLCHAILDVLVDEYMPVLDAMDKEIDWLEDQVLSSPRPEILKRILDLKHGVISLRRIITPQREVMNRLSRDEFPFIDLKARVYFRNIYDHLVRIQDLSETIRDIVAGALDIYLNSTSLKLNETMKVLTMVSTIFLPLSFIAGVFGSNFLYNPAYSWKGGTFIFTILCIVVIVFMVIWFKRKNYI